MRMPFLTFDQTLRFLVLIEMSCHSWEIIVIFKKYIRFLLYVNKE